jgi:hypothetical protein
MVGCYTVRQIFRRVGTVMEYPDLITLLNSDLMLNGELFKQEEREKILETLFIMFPEKFIKGVQLNDTCND